MNSLFSLEEMGIEEKKDPAYRVAGFGEEWIVFSPALHERTNKEHVIRFIGPEPQELTYAERKADPRWYERMIQPRAFLKCPPEHLSRFTTTQHPFMVPKPFREAKFVEMVEWIDTQTKGAWAPFLAAPRRDSFKYNGTTTQGRMLFCFEMKESAALFKLFQLFND
jgi:hypothetical protein